MSSFVCHFLGKMSAKWRKFGEEQQTRNTHKYYTRAESENKRVCSNLEKREITNTKRQNVSFQPHRTTTEKKSCDLKHETLTFYIRKNIPMLGKVKLELDDLGETVELHIKDSKILEIKSDF